MSWRSAFEYYMRRKEETYRRLREDPLFRKFREFVRWRAEKAL